MIDYRPEHDPRFSARMENARRSLRHGQGISLENVHEQRAAPLSAGLPIAQPTSGTGRDLQHFSSFGLILLSS